MSKQRRADLPHELEAPILRGILDLLDAMGIAATRSNAGGGYRLGRGGKPQLIRGMPKGWPDITGWLPRDGRFLAVECKAPGNTPTPEQWRFINWINRDGGCAFWVDDLLDCQATLAMLLKGSSVTYEHKDHPGECVIVTTFDAPPKGGPG